MIDNESISGIENNRQKEISQFKSIANRCIQCGTCSSTCPVSDHMDYTPRQVMGMVREGFSEEVLGSKTSWLCASCYSCSVICPRQIPITDIMYSLKRESIKQKKTRRRFIVPIFVNHFYRQVQRYGRQNETRLISAVYLVTNPLNLFRNIKMGWRLFRRGRISLFETGIKNKKGFRSLLKSHTTK